jgi:hypothetical protein
MKTEKQISVESRPIQPIWADFRKLNAMAIKERLFEGEVFRFGWLTLK